MPPEYLTTRELATLLRIKERKVYDLVASGKVPYSKTTGKLLFPKSAIEQWLQDSSVGIPPIQANKPTRPNVFLGSHDPLLDWALRESQCGMATFFDSSIDGLERFQGGEGCATGLHIYEPASDSWNVAAVSTRFAGHDVVLCHWAARSRGLIINDGHAASVASVEDAARLRFAPRQEKAGSQRLFTTVLEQHDLRPDSIDCIAPQRTEVDAVLSVVENRADFTFGLQSVASQHRLHFIPVLTERFDLLIDRRAWFEPSLQALFAFTRSDPFRKRAGQMVGYDISELGAVLFNG